jgi:transcription antitermination factor NusA-like protein
MDRAAALKIVREGFAHVRVERIFVEHDPLAGGDVVKIVVRDDQLAEALRGNGAHARQAAMQSGLDVEVVLASEQ